MFLLCCLNVLSISTFKIYISQESQCESGPTLASKIYIYFIEYLHYLQQITDCKTNVFPKYLVPQSIIITGRVILINNSTELKQKKKINPRLIKIVSL